MAQGDDVAVLKDVLDRFLDFSREVIVNIKFSPRDLATKRRICEQAIAGFALCVEVVIAREWQGLDPEEGRRWGRVYTDAINALNPFGFG